MTVREALANAGMLGRDLSSDSVKIPLTDTGREISAMSAEDVERFATEFDRKLEYMDPGLAAVYAEDAPSILNLIRMVNKETTDGYRGALGKGNPLDITLSRARTFMDPDTVALTARTNWKRYIRTTGTKAFIFGTAAVVGAAATTANVLTMAEEEGMRMIGWFMPADIEPKAASWQLYKNDAKSYQVFDWNARDKESGVLISKCKQPFTLPKEHSFYINVRYDDLGLDMLQPILVHIGKADQLEAL